MAYVPTPQEILAVRYEVQDVDVALPILPDATYEYILTKNTGSISASSLDAARMILMRLSISGSSDFIVDVISIKGSKAAEAYRQALQLYITSPSLNPLIKSASIYAGNVSLSDMNTNDTTADNNYVSSPSVKNVNFVVDLDTNPFGS